MEPPPPPPPPPAAEKEKRKLIEQVTGWIRLYDDGSVDRTWTGPPALEFLATPFYPSPEQAATDGVSLVDLSLPLTLRIYSPLHAAAAADLPVLLHFHGGGFCISHPTWRMYYQFYARVCAELPAVVVSVGTRLAPEHRLPAAIDDCYDALLWLRSLAGGDAPSNALRRADLSRVFLIGDSSGGNLVHAVAARYAAEAEGFWAPLRVAGCVPLHPGFARARRSRSEEEGAEDPFLTLEMVDKFLAMALPVGATKDHPYTFPPAGDGGAFAAGMPPVMVALAEGDLLRDVQVEYCDWLESLGVLVEVFRSVRVGHGFYLNGLSVGLDPTVSAATSDLIHAIKTFVETH